MKILVAETSSIINAPVETAWWVLTNTAAYPEWNPFIIRVETAGDVTQPGTHMKLFVKWLNGKQATSNEIIEDIKPPYIDNAGVKQAIWSYRFTGPLHNLGLVHAIRYHWLVQQADGTTLYRTREEFTGLFRNFIPLANVQNGFERQAKAMAAWVQ